MYAIFGSHGRRRAAALLALAALLLIPLAAPPARAADYPTSPVTDPHQTGVRWFATTGHTLRGTFLAYWEQHGGLAQFGYPITEEFTEPGPTGNKPVVVQYFERNRFEHHPENAGTAYEVLLGLLGQEFHAPDPKVAPQTGPATEYFEATGHNLGGAFLRYWQTHGGLAVHGYPISEPFQETNPIDGKQYPVQYFQRSRFELHPENAGTAYEVLLGLLGTQLARQKGYFPPATPPAVFPRFGHAADFSWIAGQVNVTRIQGGCTYLRYEDKATGVGDGQVVPTGPAWTTALNAGLAANNAYVVVSGHMAGPDEPREMCFAPMYVVDKIEPNPAGAP
jgi:hypothetical protein